MARKKSIRLAAERFRDRIEETMTFVSVAEDGLSDSQVSRLYDAGCIFLYRDFEELILEVLVGAINNDTTTISDTVGINFPRDLTDEVCYYLVTGPSYFDFKGREGLIRRIKQYVPDTHYLTAVIKDRKFKTAIEQLCALRNYAAHGSPQSKRAALAAIGQDRMSSAGAWLKRQSRLRAIADKLLEMAADLDAHAPF